MTLPPPQGQCLHWWKGSESAIPLGCGDFGMAWKIVGVCCLAACRDFLEVACTGCSPPLPWLVVNSVYKCQSVWPHVRIFQQWHMLVVVYCCLRSGEYICMHAQVPKVLPLPPHLSPLYSDECDSHLLFITVIQWQVSSHSLACYCYMVVSTISILSLIIVYGGEYHHQSASSSQSPAPSSMGNPCPIDYSLTHCYCTVVSIVINQPLDQPLAFRAQPHPVWGTLALSTSPSTSLWLSELSPILYGEPLLIHPTLLYSLSALGKWQWNSQTFFFACFMSFSQTQEFFFSWKANPFYKILECASPGSRVQQSLPHTPLLP